MDFGAIAGGAQALIGGIQTLSGAGRARKAQRQLEKMVDSYKPNQSIMDYYGKALDRYSANPYQSAMYRMQSQNAGRGLTTGIKALGDRKSVLGGVSGLVQGYNDSLLKATAGAESQQAQALGQLGEATRMKAAEDKYKFENKYNLLAMKAGGGNSIMNAGISNLYGGLGNMSSYYAAKQLYNGK